MIDELHTEGNYRALARLLLARWGHVSSIERARELTPDAIATGEGMRRRVNLLTAISAVYYRRRPKHD